MDAKDLKLSKPCFDKENWADILYHYKMRLFLLSASLIYKRFCLDFKFIIMLKKNLLLIFGLLSLVSLMAETNPKRNGLLSMLGVDNDSACCDNPNCCTQSKVDCCNLPICCDEGSAGCCDTADGSTTSEGDCCDTRTCCTTQSSCCSSETSCCASNSADQSNTTITERKESCCAVQNKK